MNEKRAVVEHVALLAKLHLKNEEIEKMREHFDKMLQYVEIINELDLEHVEPMSYPHEALQRFREDIPKTTTLRREEILEEAPDVSLHFFKSPSPLKGITKKKG